MAMMASSILFLRNTLARRASVWFVLMHGQGPPSPASQEYFQSRDTFFFLNTE